jgi:GT2 family glycosyltransferase
LNISGNSLAESKGATAQATEPAIAFEVRCVGAAGPERIELASAEQLRSARAICEEEIALIDAAIAREKIPFPSRIARERPRPVPDIRPLAPEPTALTGIPLARPIPAAPSVWTRILRRAIRQLGGVPGPPARSFHPVTADAADPGGEPGALPKITVVTVSFNQAAYLEAAIRSVLDQDYPALEYIVVDGGSNDGSVEIIDRYRDRCAAVVIEPDRGQSDALNKGFGRASGDLMTWLCSDDLLEPGSLRQVAAAWRRHHPDLIVGGCLRIGATRERVLVRHRCALPMDATLRLDPLDLLRFMRSWQRGHYFYQPEVFFSRRAWEAAGGHLKPYLHYGMDYDLWVRMALAGATIRVIPPLLACSRVHPGQKTRDDRAWYHQFRQVLEEYRDLLSAMEARL